MSADIPFITVVMPVRNEARFIADTLEQLRGQDYPRDRFEILVADGMSDDGTRDIVSRIAAEDGRVRLLDNSKKRSSAGRNVGFRAGRGDLFVVVDGHCYIPSGSMLKNVARLFQETGADCLGRPQPLTPPDIGVFQQAVAIARASRIGHGGGSLIFSDFEGYAVPDSNGAAYSRKCIDSVGLVDEDFDACEDVEYNLRVRKAGLNAYTSPSIAVCYYPRDSLSGLFRQMFRYGVGRCRLLRKHKDIFSIFTIVPSFFAAGVMLLPVLLALIAFDFFPFLMAWPLIVCLFIYIFLVLTQSITLSIRHGWHLLMLLPRIYSTIHFGLGMGFLWELFARNAGGRKGVKGKW